MQRSEWCDWTTWRRGTDWILQYGGKTVPHYPYAQSGYYHDPNENLCNLSLRFCILGASRQWFKCTWSIQEIRMHALDRFLLNCIYSWASWSHATMSLWSASLSRDSILPLHINCIFWPQKRLHVYCRLWATLNTTNFHICLRLKLCAASTSECTHDTTNSCPLRTR